MGYKITKTGVVDINDFPISLVGGVYKIIPKVLANKLKTVLGKIISKTRNAFIKGRQTLVSVLIANKCLHGRILLDLKKAYDHVN